MRGKAITMLTVSMLVMSGIMAILSAENVIADTEPNDDFDEAEEITPGTYGGEVSNGDLDDYYKIYLEHSSIVEIDYTSNSTDSDSQRLILYSTAKESEVTLYSKNGVSDSGEFYLANETVAGYWYVRIYASGGSYGTYSFNLSVSIQNDAGSGGDAPGDFDNAYEIEEGTYSGILMDFYSGKDLGYDGKDCYKVYVKPGEVININFTAENTMSDRINLELYSLNRIEKFTLQSYNNVTETDSFYTANETTADYWYIMIDEGDGYGPYNFDIWITCQNDAGSGGDVPGDFDNAYEIEEGTYSGILMDFSGKDLGYDEDDYYKILLGPKTTITVNFTAEEGKEYLKFYDPFKSIEFTLTSQYGSTETESYYLDESSEIEYYFIKITCEGNRDLDGKYSFDLNVEVAPPESSCGPLPNNWVIETNQDINATANSWGATNVSSVDLFYLYSANGSDWSAENLFETDSVDPWGWSFDFPDGEGYYEFYSIASDTKANVEAQPGAADASCGHDLTPPTIVDNTTSIATTGEEYMVQAMVTDNLALSDVYTSYWFGNGNETNVSMTADANASEIYETVVDIPEDSVDMLHYRISVCDEAGHWSYIFVTDITVEDNDNPEAVAGGYENVTRGEVTVSADASSDNVGIVNYTWTFHDGEESVTIWNSTFSHDFQNLGQYELVLTVLDGAGNNASDTKTITVRETAMVLDETPPLPDSGINRSIEVGHYYEFTFEDYGYRITLLNVSGSTVGVTVSTFYSDGRSVRSDIIWEEGSSNLFENGKLVFGVTSVDPSSQSATFSFMEHADEGEEESAEGMNMMLPLGILAVIIVVILVLAVVIMKKKASAPPPPPEE